MGTSDSEKLIETSSLESGSFGSIKLDSFSDRKVLSATVEARAVEKIN